MQILLACLVSFSLGVDVACGDDHECDLEALSDHIKVSELSYIVVFSFSFQKLYIVRMSCFDFFRHTNIGRIMASRIIKVSNRFNFKIKNSLLLIPIRFFKYSL